MCEVLKVSRSGYYRWFSCAPSQRSQQNKVLTEQIREVFLESNQTYGSPRITQELRKQGIEVSRPRVARLMKKAALTAKHKRSHRTTTDSKHHFAVAPNLLQRNFSADRLAQAWVSDITHIQTRKGWLYLTVIIDLADRKVIGWAMGQSLKAQDTVIPAFLMACGNRMPTLPLIFHSDRGVQYACTAFRNVLKNYPQIRQSMSRKADCWDNAVAESFFKTLKVERVYRQKYETPQQAKNDIFEYIEAWYNNRRRHSAIDFKTPAEMEQDLNFNRMAA